MFRVSHLLCHQYFLKRIFFCLVHFGRSQTLRFLRVLPGNVLVQFFYPQFLEVSCSKRGSGPSGVSLECLLLSLPYHGLEPLKSFSEVLDSFLLFGSLQCFTCLELSPYNSCIGQYHVVFHER